MNKNSIINKIINKQSLDVFKIGCDRKNFEILKDIIKKKRVEMKFIETQHDLSTMPANRRINLMVEVGLVKRINRKRDIMPTPLAKRLVDLIDETRKYLRKEITKESGN